MVDLELIKGGSKESLRNGPRGGGGLDSQPKQFSLNEEALESEMRYPVKHATIIQLKIVIHVLSSCHLQSFN